MQYGSVKKLIKPLLEHGHQWQYIDINGDVKKPKLYFSNIQWILLLISSGILFRLTTGLSNEIIGYIISAFAISVSLFMSLLVSIFDKFESTNFDRQDKTEEEIVRLKQKRNFFKRFISITSYLVVLSIVIVVLCSLSYVFDLPQFKVLTKEFTLDWEKINFTLTLKNGALLAYRVLLNYLLLDYLLLTLFISGSAFEYYMSEINRRKILD